MKKTPVGKSRSTSKRVKPSEQTPLSPIHPAWEHASLLVQQLIKLMEQGIDPATDMPEHWERVFGNKDSAVSNLQKLVNVLASIAQHVDQKSDVFAEHLQDVALSDEDYAMLKRWFESEMKQKTSE